MHNRHFIEENVRMVNKYKKMFNLTGAQEKEKLKQHRRTISNP